MNNVCVLSNVNFVFLEAKCFSSATHGHLNSSVLRPARRETDSKITKLKRNSLERPMFFLFELQTSQISKIFLLYIKNYFIASLSIIEFKSISFASSPEVRPGDFDNR